LRLLLSRLEERVEALEASNFTYAQKAFIVKQSNEGTTVAEICRKSGISPATYFNGKKVRRADAI
jgi:transposase-like protein